MKSTIQFCLLIVGAAVILGGAVVAFWSEADSGRLATKPSSPRISETRLPSQPEYSPEQQQPPEKEAAVETSIDATVAALAPQSPSDSVKPSVLHPHRITQDLNDPLVTTVHPVEPSAPGTVISAADQFVVVESYVSLPGRAGPELTLITAPQSSFPETALTSRTASGLSYEDELFRTKWGWAAWDAAGRAAREAAQTTE